MLAPGEFLINPNPPRPPGKGADGASTSVLAATTTAEVEAPEVENSSFLLILLRALGAIHS